MFLKRSKITEEKDKVPIGTDEVIRLSDIYVPERFRHSPPKPWKVDRALKLCLKLGHLDKPITVIAETNEQGHSPVFVLVDGYSRYKAVFRLGYSRVPIKYIGINEYISTDCEA